MRTLDIIEAANFLKCGEDTVRELAAAGDMPSAKVGRAWVFVDVDLIDWLRSQYKSCHSINEVKSIGRASPSKESDINELLGLTTSRWHTSAPVLALIDSVVN